MRSDPRLLGGGLVVLALVAAIIWWWLPSAASTPALPPPLSTTVARSGFAHSTPTTSGASAAIVVDVVGAVHRDGIVRLHAGARVADAIAAAGGATADADLVRLNLAAPVTDGARVAVPRVGAAAPTLDPAAVSSAAGGGGDVSAAATGPVNLNTATAAELDALPGVGPATAATIVRDREAHGPFRAVDDLARVRGIGPAKLDQLRGLVTV